MNNGELDRAAMERAKARFFASPRVQIALARLRVHKAQRWAFLVDFGIGLIVALAILSLGVLAMFAL